MKQLGGLERVRELQNDLIALTKAFEAKNKSWIKEELENIINDAESMLEEQ